MITTCTGCQQKYRLDASKVPERLINVRCPQCETVFLLDGTSRESIVDPEVASAPPAASVDSFGDIETSAPTQPASQPAPSVPAETPVTQAAPEHDFSQAIPEVEATKAAAPAPTPTSENSTAVAVEEKQPEAAGDAVKPKRRRREKTEMLARALVSDILVYNQNERDQALKEGNLLEALGPEIKKSWELYKEKVTPEVANSTNYFREALNDILADGDKVF